MCGAVVRTGSFLVAAVHVTDTVLVRATHMVCGIETMTAASCKVSSKPHVRKDQSSREVSVRAGRVLYNTTCLQNTP